MYPWMQIKLPTTVNLTSVTVINRLDCCGEVARMLEVRAGLDQVPLEVDGKILAVNGVCGRVAGGGVDDVIQCDKPILAQYLTVQMLHKGSLVVNEIQVNSGRLMVMVWNGKTIPTFRRRLPESEGVSKPCPVPILETV